MEGKIKYEFSTKLWKHASPGGWHFVSLPKTISKEIRAHLKWQEEGWGRMKALVAIKTFKWKTAIWFDTKRETYLLPVKSKIRTRLNLEINQNLDIQIWV